MSNSRYPYILFFRHYKYASIDNFIESNKDAFMCSFHIINDVNELNKLYNPNYHILITYGNYEEYQYYILPHIPSRFCKRWIHKQDISNIEEFNKHVNYCYISNVIDNRENTRPVFSIFTTCYKSYEYINTAYESIKKQTLKDWEWVIMDDTPEDDHFTFLKKTLANDNRVRLYKRDKNSGNIGNVKNEVISLCRGKYILEMDHDDEILKDCLSDSFHIFESDPEVGFVYGDTINLFRNGQNSMYGENLCKGYSGYYSECINNYWGYVYNTPNINNITLSHLTCLPNHPRIWKRSVLMELESYSEFLPICDDYEILLRTCCSKYKVVKNNKAQYIQYMNDKGNNFSTIRNAEINRIGPVYISPMFYEKYGVHDKMKQLDAYENPIYITHHSDIWKRGPEYQHKRMNSRINMDYNKQYCIINDAIDNDRLKELYNNDKNDFLFLSNKLTLPEVWNKLNSLGFYRMKCYSYKDCTEEELVNFFHMMYKNDNCYYEIITNTTNYYNITNNDTILDLSSLNVNYFKNVFTNASPFKHIILDNIINEKLLNNALNEINNIPESELLSEYVLGIENVQINKFSYREFNKLNYISRIKDYFESDIFIDWLEKVTGIDNLQKDTTHNGAGIHIIKQNGKLDIHSDFNRHRSTMKYRRLNLLLYLNKDYKEDYNGHLELWNKEMTVCEQKIAPLFNRIVLFKVDDDANHGHPEIWNSEKTNRTSLALYYYTDDRPEHEKSENYNAVWKNKPVNLSNKIGIFNSFPFHYEMFGFILNYAKNNDFEVDIFTNTQNNMGWLDFYNNNFNNFNIIDYKNFNGNTSQYSYYFISTDDDPLFKSEWISNNVICLNHYYKIRTPNHKHYLNIARFCDNSLDYVYPCYNLNIFQNKAQNNTVNIIGGWNGLNFSIVNRLHSNNKIKLNIFVRNSEQIKMEDMSILDKNKFDIHFKIAIDTTEMIDELNKSSYIFINYNDNNDHNTGRSCSGSMQLALSTLCKPIMAKTANKYLQIENALEFDIGSDEPINIDDEIDFKAIEQERNKYVNDFEKYLNNIKQSYNFEHDKVNDDINKKNLCLLTYGELRTFKNNFRNNLLEFLPILQNYKNTYIFILLDEKNYVRDKHYEYIENICKEFNIKIGFIETMETLNYSKKYVEEEINYYNKLILQKKNNKLFPRSLRTEDDINSTLLPNDYLLRFYYRKYKLIELVEQYCFVNKLDISDILYARVFDCIIKQNIPSNDIYLNIKNTNLENNIYFSPDTTFIGNHKLIKKVIKYDKIYNCDELWNNIGFRNFSYKFDSILTNNKDTYAPEIQYTANIYFQSINAYNLRYYRPDPNCLDKHLMYEIILDPNRHNTIKLDSNNIPKKLFQTWETTNIEPEFQKIIDKWKEFNPDYEYIFHDSEQRLKFIEENFEENVVNAYNKIIPGAYKCDLWRYCILYIYGGFYADIDTLCTGKLNDLTSDNIDFIVPIDLNLNPVEGFHNLACGFFGSIPNSPILLDAINRIVFNVENNIIPESKLDFSGPGILGRAVNKFLKLEETSSFKGKEGIKNSIKFLHFDSNTEYVSDINTNKIILQNKNKNSDIIRLYNNECNKINGFKSWTWTSVSPI